MHFTNNIFSKICSVIFLTFILNFNLVFAAPTVSVTPSTQSISAGAKATVKITTTGAIKCTVTGGNYNKNNTLINGNILLSPTQTTNYIFICTDTSGNATQGATNVTVTGTTQTTNITNTTNTNTNNTNITGTLNNPLNTNNSTQQSQAPKIQYPNQTVQTEAQRICQQYTASKNVYGDPTIGGADGTVPTNLPGLIDLLKSIDKNTRLGANELRDADLIRFCTELPNMAAAAQKVAQDAAKQLKTIADTCQADEKCLLKRKYEVDVQNEIDEAQKIPVLGQQIAKLILYAGKKPISNPTTFDYDLIKKCNDAYSKGRNPDECLMVPYDEDVITETVDYAKARIDKGQTQLAGEFYDGKGVIGTRPCTKTVSGSDPTNVNWYDKDCVDFKKQPVLITQEVLKQITDLPYTQAFSQTAILGADQAIDNINTRSRNGNLIDPDIGNGFGSIAGGSGNPNNGGNFTNGTDMKTVEPNYKKILSNITVITTLYAAAKAGYASSTSACKNLPVQTRATAIQRIDTYTQTYVAYVTDLTARWNAAIKTPNENHLDLVTKINFDLKDTYNQDMINKAADAVKALLQACVNTTTTS